MEDWISKLLHHYCRNVFVRVVNEGLGFILFSFSFFFILFGYRQRRQNMILHVTITYMSHRHDSMVTYVTHLHDMME